MAMKSFKLPEATDPADGRDRVTISPIPPTSHRLLSKTKGQQRDVFSISLDFAFTRHPCDVCRMSFPLRPFTFLIFPFSMTPSFYSFRSILLFPLYRLFLSLSCFPSSYLLNDHRYRPFDRLIHSIYCSARSCQAAMYIYRYENILRLTSLYHRRTRSFPCSYTQTISQFN